MHRSIITGLCMLVFCGPAPGAERVLPPYPPDIPGANVETYKRVNDVDLKVWILHPERGAAKGRAAVIFFFGGGWVFGSPVHFERQARILNELGVVGILADYRVQTRHGTKAEAAVADAKSAVRWVRKHADRLGIDADRIGAAGGSAGGHLAAATATVPGFEVASEDLSISAIPNALILFNPALVIAPVEGVHQPSNSLSDRFSGPLIDISPFHHLAAGGPPTLVLHGSKDNRVPFASALAYCEKAVELGDLCEIATYPGAQHAFFNRDPYFQPTVRQMTSFLGSLGWLQESPKAE